jgi:hypothetical protein
VSDLRLSRAPIAGAFAAKDHQEAAICFVVVELEVVGLKLRDAAVLPFL